MVLNPGARIGPYEVVAPLGAGGMGEVYRASDARLGREVAIKILPEAFAADPDHLARFQREAQLLASLNHPNIAIIHGLEEQTDVGAGFSRLALVMELVEGPTLADRIEQGPLPLDEALPIAKQIAEALEAAHDRGVIHRDLKPANVKVTPDGKVKVLDFGLAKLVEAGGAGGAGEAGRLSMSPTLSVQATYAGVILGTAAYMSPEQARGRPVDRRADVWAFGCVLFEMLTGKQAFDAGETVSDAVAAILKNDPDWNALAPETPAHIRTLLRRCLQKDVRRRLPHIGVARIDIDEGSASDTGAANGLQEPAVRSPAWRRALPWAVAGALAAVLASVLALGASWRTSPAPGPVRLEATLGVDASLSLDPATAAVLSPDGTVLAFSAQPSAGQGQQLYLRRLDQLQATPLAGTEGAFGPFFSPDGQWIAFFAGGELKKVSVAGGAVVTLCDAPNGRGGYWAEDDTITFTPDTAIGVGLMRVSAAGGKPQALMTLVEGEVTHRWPQILPGGTAVLYTAHSRTAGFDQANLVVQPLPSGSPKVVHQGGYHGRYLPSGHLVYVYDGTLFAARFDLDRLELGGQPVPALQGVAAIPRSGGAQLAVSDTGTLVYVAGQPLDADAPISWVDRQGRTSLLRSLAADWGSPVFSPDGRELAMDIGDGKQLDVWVYDWARDTMSRLTFDSGSGPVWTPDGRRIAFASTRANRSTNNLYWQRADGTGEVQRLTESLNHQNAASWHPSGKFLAYMEQHPQTDADIMILPLDGDEASGWMPGKPAAFLNTPASEREPEFSPDGRWVAYFSNETGRAEIYVRPFPGPGGKWQISTEGGVTPVWSKAREELLFRAATDRRLMAVPYSVDGGSFRAQRPHVWSETRLEVRPRTAGTPIFDLHPDGVRVAAAVAPEETNVKQDKLVFIFNFFEELRRIAPTR